MIVMMTQREKR